MVLSLFDTSEHKVDPPYVWGHGSHTFYNFSTGIEFLSYKYCVKTLCPPQSWVLSYAPASENNTQNFQ